MYTAHPVGDVLMEVGRCWKGQKQELRDIYADVTACHSQAGRSACTGLHWGCSGPMGWRGLLFKSQGVGQSVCNAESWVSLGSIRLQVRGQSQALASMDSECREKRQVENLLLFPLGRTITWKCPALRGHPRDRQGSGRVAQVIGKAWRWNDY